jgi:isoleucyl-tRNA synthetase
MPITNYNALEIEPEILEFWKKDKIYSKAKEKAKGEDFYFLDGPPYTSGKVHLGTAWNKSLKDSVLRYKRMQGFNVWDRAGYDTHGLPTAHKVQEKFNLTHKDEIPQFGIKKFVQECKKLCIENKDVMNEDFTKMGVWMDFKNPYMTLDNSFMEGEWWLVKKAHENNRLYEGEKVMHWCSSCSTALAKHELEYENVTDNSIFLKLKIKGTDNEYLVIWTTTPWTIPFNLGVMVNPEEDYVKAKVDDEIWFVAGKLANVFISGVAEKKYEILDEFKGEQLEGTKYIHPLYDELKDIYNELKSKSEKVHTVLLSKEYVDTSSGTGLVHMAPGCGPEDYEVGHKNGIPPFNNILEDGKFPDSMGPFAGLIAKKDDKKFIEYFDEHNFLIASNPVEHEYAHCWRCHKGVVFRLTKQWFFKVEDLKEKMRELNKEIQWQPDWAGNKQFDSWLDNLRDNSITRQRYWGCPVPIWKCDKCDNYEVIGSIKELEEKSKMKAPADLHIPHIDEVKIPCSCTGTMHRIQDILDVWVDAGVASWTCLNYPQEDENFKKLWPADFILEGKDQIRGWFNLLFVASMVSMDLPSFKAVYMHGMIMDSKGRKMSKSLGNYILPEEVISKYGADTLRYYAIGGANPGLDLNYNFEDMKLKHKNLMVLWNIHKFLVDLSATVGKSPNKIESDIESNFSIEENFIISKLNTTIMDVTKLFDSYRLNEVPLKIEELYLELSRTYIQLIRDKASIGEQKEKEAVLYTIHKVLLDCLKLFTPVAPFITEKIYQNLKSEFKLDIESIHLFDWPKYDTQRIQSTLESQMDTISNVIQSILYAREKANIGLRWPLQKVNIITTDKDAIKAVEELGSIIKNQTNIKELNVQESMPGIKETVKADFAKLGPLYGEKTPKIIAKIATESQETIADHIEKEGKYVVDIEGENCEITKDHLITQRTVPEGFVESEFKSGLIYLDKNMSKELEAEGFARELMRKIQSMRKDNDMQKTDDIVLYIKTDHDTVYMLEKFNDTISNKCGASKMKISELNPAKKHEIVAQIKIKGIEFEIYFDKVN